MLGGPVLIGPGYFFSDCLVNGPGPTWPGSIFGFAYYFGPGMTGPDRGPGFCFVLACFADHVLKRSYIVGLGYFFSLLHLPGKWPRLLFLQLFGKWVRSE